MRFREDQSSQKLRGGYYTPPDLAAFISRWVSRIRPMEILEPSCGDGAFFPGLARCDDSGGARVTACESDPIEATKATARARRLRLSAAVHPTDFLAWALPQLAERRTPFDAAIGNPPFIRYQYLPPRFQAAAARIFASLGCRFTRHTNAWVPFLLASIALLRPGGRLGMIVPAEVLHVRHAQSLRAYLATHCRRVVVIDPVRLWFPDTLQGAVILLAQKKDDGCAPAHRVGVHSVRDREFLASDPDDIFRSTPTVNSVTTSGKWTPALLASPVRSILDDAPLLPTVRPFERIGSAQVGIVTGANAFFLVDDATVARFGLGRVAHPMFGRSAHCPGIIYDRAQHRRNASAGQPTNFLWFRNASSCRSSRVREYLAMGESQSLHLRFKCRIRNPWYAVPSVYSTHLSMLKRAHDAPRLVLNRAAAFTTDTAYRVRSTLVPAESLAACFLNPLTALSAEIEGRHYGGGVLELIPSEIRNLLVPLPARSAFDIVGLDEEVRRSSMTEVLGSHGFKVLAAAGLSKNDSVSIMDGWAALRSRRHRKPMASGHAAGVA